VDVLESVLAGFGGDVFGGFVKSGRGVDAMESDEGDDGVLGEGAGGFGCDGGELGVGEECGFGRLGEGGEAEGEREEGGRTHQCGLFYRVPRADVELAPG